MAKEKRKGVQDVGFDFVMLGKLGGALAACFLVLGLLYYLFELRPRVEPFEEAIDACVADHCNGANDEDACAAEHCADELAALEGERHTLGDAYWLTIVTISTVGYGDDSPSHALGRWSVVAMILFSITVFSFLISRIETAVSERNHLKRLGMQGTRFQGHVVVCSLSPIGSVVLKELLAAERQVAVICEEEAQLARVRELGSAKQIFATVGDVTSEEALYRANVTEAQTVVAAAQDDTKNLIVALEIQRLNPTARIVVSTERVELRDTLASAGVTYVATPYDLSGRLVASAAFEPEVARFLEDVTSGAGDDEDQGGYDLQQFTLPSGADVTSKTVANLRTRLRAMRGPLLLAIAKPDPTTGDYTVMPHPKDDIILDPGDSIVVLGNDEQNDRVASTLGVLQGR